MVWKVIKWIILIIVVVVIGYIGLSIWSSSCAGPLDDQYDMPDIKEASHEFYIENTGGLVFTSDYEQHGQGIGSRMYILHGYWKMRGNKFVFLEGDIILSEKTFGEITVKRRLK